MHDILYDGAYTQQSRQSKYADKTAEHFCVWQINYILYRNCSVGEKSKGCSLNVSGTTPASGLIEDCTTLAQIDYINGKLPPSPLYRQYEEIDPVNMITT